MAPRPASTRPSGRRRCGWTPSEWPSTLWRRCGAEGLTNVVTGSTFRSTFGADYGVTLADGPLAGLLSRAVVVLDESGKVVYTEQVPEVGQEPDYDAAVAALS